jgi:hypothetical protein
MHSSSGSGTGFGPRSNIKCKGKVKKIKKLEANFLINNAASSIEEALFSYFLYKFFVVEKLC